MIKEGILAAYLLWMAAVDAKTKTVPVWPGIAGILLFSVTGVILMAVKKKGKTYRLAFVPFISAAFAAIEIVKWKG